VSRVLKAYWNQTNKMWVVKTSCGHFMFLARRRALGKPTGSTVRCNFCGG